MRPDYAALNRTAPEFELPALGGGRVRLTDYRGKVVILNFWTKTCRPCLEELPSLRKLGHALSGSPRVELVTISTDPSLADVQATLNSVLGGDPPFAVLVDPEAAVVTDKFGTKLFPETWYIDPQGVIRARFDGARDWGQALAMDLAESLLGPSACGVEFRRGRAVGRLAGVCE
jgi:peroxiredoxin